MFYLLKSYVSKEKGNKNPEYGTKVLNFSVDLYASDKRDFSFVSTNIFSISLCHVKRLIAANR